MAKVIKKCKRLFQNDRKLAKFLSIAAILLLVAVITPTVLFQYAFGLQNPSYGYGYYGNAYGYGYGYSSQVPSAVATLNCFAASGTVIGCQFTAVTTCTDSTDLDNFSTYEIYYSTTDATPDTGDTAGGTGTTQGSGTVSISTSGLTAATSYYVAVYTVDDQLNYSAISNVATVTTAGDSSSPTSSAPGPSSTYSPGDDGDGDAGDAIDGPLTSDQLAAESGNVVPSLPADRDMAAEQSALSEVIALTGALPTSEADWQVVQYIAYGATASSQTYSSRERRDIMYDYYQMFGSFPASTSDWEDVNLMINGHRPLQRAIDREVMAIDHFRKVYLRDPDWSNEHDTWAVVYMAYAVRYRPRDLAKERIAITTFRGIYGYTPEDATDWSVVRAIAYSGAAR